MRTTSLRRARAAAVLTTAVALGSLSLSIASPASATVIGPLPGPPGVESVSFGDDPVGAGTCTKAGGASAPTPVSFVADGLPHTTTVSDSAMFTHDTDPTDVTTASGTATRTITATQAGGQLSHVSVKDTFSATTSSTLGTAQKCNVSVQAVGQAGFTFDLVRPTYVSLTAHSNGMIVEGIIASNLAALTLSPNEALAAAIASGRPAGGTGHILLPAGSFYAGVSLGVGGITAPQSASGDSSLEISFDTPGIATSATTGDGKKYVDLPAGADCTTHSAVATWKSKAGKGKNSHVKKATFKVESAKVGSAKKPVKKKTTALKVLPAEGPFTVTGTIKLTSGKTVTVSRDYQACS